MITAELDILRKKSLHQQWSIFIFRKMDFNLVGDPTFKFWSLVLKYQRGIFLFIRANRERKINLMISARKEFVHLFFAFDHYSYTRWMPLLFFQDLETLPKRVKAEFEMGRFVLNRSCHRSSSLPIDHAHEQINKKSKGVWGELLVSRKILKC